MIHGALSSSGCGIVEVSHSKTSGVESGMHEASQIVVGAGSGGLTGIGEDGIGMYLGSKEAWVLGSHFWLDALKGGKPGSEIGLEAEEA